MLERAVRKCDADSEAAEVFDLAELYLELATEYQVGGGGCSGRGARGCSDAGSTCSPIRACARRS